MMNKTISCGFNDILGINGVIKEIAAHLDETGITRLRRVCRELRASITSDIFTDALQRRFGYLLAAKPSELTSVLNEIPEQDRTPETIYKAIASSTNTIIKQYDKKKVLAAVKQDGWELQYACDDLRNNPEVVLAAVIQDYLALQYASADLRNNPEIVLAAVKETGHALRFASSDLRNKENIVLAAVRQDCLALHYASDDLRNDKLFVLVVVTEHGWALKYAHDDLRNNPRVVLAAVKQNRQALQFASADLRNDPEFIRAIATLQNNRPTRYSYHLYCQLRTKVNQENPKMENRP